MSLETVPLVEITDIHENSNLNKWFLTSTPVPVIVILVIYLLTVLKIGPKFMEKREPYNINAIMMVYNLYQIIYNSYFVGLVLLNREVQRYVIEHFCRPLHYTKNPFNDEFYYGSWCFLFSKIVDLLDTFFMVLKKKNSHITFLHLYHHTTMVSGSWISIKYMRGEQGIIPCAINCGVHVIMYTYYFLAALGPEVQKYLWWKRYLTKIQIAQFIIVIAFFGYLYLKDCEVSQAYNVLWVTNVIVIFCLFMNFYIKTYLLSDKISVGVSGFEEDFHPLALLWDDLNRTEVDLLNMDVEMVLDVIRSLNPRSAIDPDDIPPFVIKGIADVVAPILTFLAFVT
ncbi:very long chain fatty acid elongase 7-like [Lycorma delicatula]|uniref:very long chain fatty acid elongase 7-like n=1 Tax=Lycorma delicatula TaxID=130591 RepID=UPI003F50DF2B